MHRTLKNIAAKPSRPRVLIVGSEDVHARMDLMHGLSSYYDVAAAGTSPELATQFAQNGFAYFNYPLDRGVGPVADGCAFVALVRLLNQYRPQIVHAFDTKPGVYGCLAARFAGVPVVIGTVTGLGSLYVDHGLRPQLVRGVYERLQRMASQYADLTIFQNRDDREEFVSRRVVPAGRAALIAGSGVHTERYDPTRISDAERLAVRASLGIPIDAPLVTMIARVIRSKGVEEFVEASRRVRQSHPRAHFLLIGQADQNSVDRFSTDELAEISRTVNWPGVRNDIPRVLAASDMFVLPSFLREGIPRVLLEAAAMGLPLITTNSPGCNDVVEEGVNGYLVPPRDPAALSLAINNLIEKPDLRRFFGQVSRKRAVEHFDLAVVVKKTRMFYDELLLKKVGRLRCTA